MSRVCYAAITGAELHQVSPAQFACSVQYSIVDTASNSAVLSQSGTFTATLDNVLNAPITNQNSVLTAAQAAIQAAEPGSPGLTFIWLGL